MFKYEKNLKFGLIFAGVKVVVDVMFGEIPVYIFNLSIESFIKTFCQIVFWWLIYFVSFFIVSMVVNFFENKFK